MQGKSQIIRWQRIRWLVWVGLATITLIFCLASRPGIAHDRPIPNIAQTTLSASALEQQAQQQFAAGQFAAAIALLQQALTQYQQQGDVAGQAVVLSNLSLAYQKLGSWPQATETVNQALALLEGKTVNPEQRLILAQALDVQGTLLLARGQAGKAVTAWEQAASLYGQAGKTDRAILAQLNQAQALQTAGFYRQVIAKLEFLKQALNSQPDSELKATVLRNLGDALRVAGDLTQAEQVAQSSLTIAQQVRDPAAHDFVARSAIAAAHLSLGNIAQAQGKGNAEQQNIKAARERMAEALKQYQAAASGAGVPAAIQTEALLNRLRLLTDTPTAWLPTGTQQWQEAEALYPQVQRQLNSLPPGRSAIYARINLAESLMRLRQARPTVALSWNEIGQMLAEAVQQAKALDDSAALSYALGNLGKVYAQTNQWENARDLTQQALVLAQALNAQDIAYQWQWQLGQVLKAQGDYATAIAAYTEAFSTLQSIRRDLVASNPDVQFSFRDNVEPVYRELVDLLLRPQGQAPISQTNLRQARQVLEALQVAQLENFLQAACQEPTLLVDEVVKREDRTAAIIYPIILADRLEVIVKLPQTDDLFHPPPIVRPKAEIQKVLADLRDNLQQVDQGNAFQSGAKTVYDWLIRPVKSQLDQQGIKTLVFVLDGPLRSIPMSALYDGQQYLVEQYAVSLILGLEVRDPVALTRSHLKVLAAGLTNPPPAFQEFGALENVNRELDAIVKSGLPSTVIRDQNFTSQAFNKAFNSNPFQIVHLATHGQFGVDRQSTFLLAADDKIDINNLDTLFRTQRRSRSDAIELLILSACETAEGDDRAVLGLAGTIVKAGSRSAIAGLWSLADEPSVQFTQTLYQNLGQSGVNRAEALRLAQTAFLKGPDSPYTHPRYWAPYVLVGSWL